MKTQTPMPDNRTGAAAIANGSCPPMNEDQIAKAPTAPQPGDPASRSAIAQAFLDEDFQECSSFDLADIVLKHWDVRWKANAPGHDDLMVTPESIDPWLKDNPLPPQSERNCQKCGVPTHGEEAWVDGQIWCHPCADASTERGAES